MPTATTPPAEPIVDDAPASEPAAEPPPSAQRTMVSAAEDIVQVIEIASRLEGNTFEPTAISRTVTRVLADLGAARHPLIALAASCPVHGLTATSLRSAPEQLAERLDEGVTMVVERLQPSRGWLVLSAPSGSAAIHCHELVGGTARRLRGSAQKLLRELAAHHLEVDVLAIENGFPLDALRSPDPGPHSAFRKLATLVRLERSELTTVMIYAAFIGLLTLVMPVSVQALVNTIAFGSLLQPLVILGLALFAGLVVSAVLQALRHYVVEILQRRIFVRTVSDFGRRLPRWSAAISRSQDTRELVNRFFDVVTLQKSAASLAVDALGLALQTAIGLLLLAFYHPALLGFAVVLVATLLALIGIPMRMSAKSAIVESKAKYATVAWLESVADHGALFADANAGRQASSRADALARQYLHARHQHWRDLLWQIAGGLSVQVIASVALLLIGGWLVMQRQLTIGQLVASELVVALIGAGFGKLGKHMEKLYDAVAAVDKLSQVVQVERERDGGQLIDSSGAARLDIRQLSDRRLAAMVNVSLAPGEVVAVSGPEASGKSTLLQMLQGRLAPERGNLLVDGVDLADADLQHYRVSVCWLDADGRAPNLTIAELLRLHAPAASSAALSEALERVGLGDAIERIPDGIDQRLLPHGGPLSRSEMMRLGVARLLLHKPRLALIDGTLDELADDAALLTAALDGPWTTIVATRSQRVLERASRVVSLKPDLATEPAAQPQFEEPEGDCS